VPGTVVSTPIKSRNVNFARGKTAVDYNENYTTTNDRSNAGSVNRPNKGFLFGT